MAKRDDHKSNGTPTENVPPKLEETHFPHAHPDPDPPKGMDLETGELKAPPPPPEPPKIERIPLLSVIQAKNLVGRKEMKYTRVGDSKDPKDYPPRELYRVFGTAFGTETGTSQYGDWVRFVGSFEAMVWKDKQRSKSPRLFLPPVAEPLLLDALAEIKRWDATASVTFCFDVGVRVSQRWLDTDEGNSYEYTCASVFSTQKADPLAAIRENALLASPPPSL